MKDADQNISLSTTDEAERFQVSFSELREDLENKITSSDLLPQENLKSHFSELNNSLQSLQRLYSSSSPYLRIYYRKIYQDALQALQTSIQDTEARLLPRKKFVFKGNRAKKAQPVVVKIDNNSIEKLKDNKTLDLTDGPNTSVYRDRVDAVIVIPASAVTGKAVLLARLQNCTVQMMGAPSTVHIADISNSSICLGPVATSVFVEGAHSCNLQLACQQLRVHETIDTDFYIHVTSKAIIEDCRNVRFGIYNYSYPTIDEDYLLAGLRKDVNNWQDVDDFNWLVVGQQSPNWSIVQTS